MRYCVVFAIILVISLTLMWHGSFAADISMTAVVQPKVIPVGSEATLVVTVKGKFRKSSTPQLPDLAEITFYQAGSSQSFSIVNGQATSSLQFTYVLVPHKEGRYTIEPIRFEAGGDTYTAPPVDIEVVKSSAQLPPPTADDSEPMEDVGTDSPIFIRATVDHDTVYVNEQVTWTLSFYTDGRVDLLRSPEFSPPGAEGFWVEDLPPQQSFYKMIKSSKYLVNEIKRGFFPTAPGEYKIGAARVEIVLDDFGSRSLDDFFNRRLRTFGFGKPKTLTTDEIPITVLPLPTHGRPSTFSGLVGRHLTVGLVVDKQVVEAGEPVNVTLEIEGQGNFKTMAAPDIPDIPGFKVYESGSSSDLFKNDYVVSGRKRVEFVVIPQVEGTTTIPPVKLSYFDPVERVYKTIQTKSVQIDVKPGTKEKGGRQVVFTGTGEDIEVLGTDIRFIHPVPAEITVTRSNPLLGRAYVGLHALPLLAVIVSVFVERRRRRWLDDAPAYRAHRAAREAEKRLAKVNALSKRGEPLAIFSETSLAVRGYLADKMNKAIAGLTSQEASAFLHAKGVSDEDTKRVLAVLAACDGAQYSASASSIEQATATLDQALRVIEHLEKEYLG